VFTSVVTVSGANVITGDIADIPEAPSANEVASAVWDKDVSDHQSSGTAGKHITDIKKKVNFISNTS
jgi:hypothetical protein